MIKNIFLSSKKRAILLALFTVTVGMFPINSFAVKNKKPSSVHVEEVSLTKAQIKAANITVKTMALTPLNDTLKTTGEVQVNGYTSSVITPRIDSIVIARHVQLGDHIKKNQTLVTLFSVQMAKLQSRFITISYEWDRVKKLGTDVISSKRLIQTEMDYNETKALLKAYGMSLQDILNLEKKKAMTLLGEYRLYSPQRGTITADDFQIGSSIETGSYLFEINNEATVWIESPLSSKEFERAFKARTAFIKNETYEAIAQIVTAHEKLDKATRRRKIRLVVSNPEHKLHSGEFVNVVFLIPSEEQGITVPKNTILRSADGDWVIYLQDEDGDFKPREISIVRAIGDNYLISGVNIGERAVINGAFLIHSEFAKSAFSVNNH
jgi:RND family efflux transporter MFP subunit